MQYEPYLPASQLTDSSPTGGRDLLRVRGARALAARPQRPAQHGGLHAQDLHVDGGGDHGRPLPGERACAQLVEAALQEVQRPQAATAGIPAAAAHAAAAPRPPAPPQAPADALRVRRPPPAARRAGERPRIRVQEPAAAARQAPPPFPLGETQVRLGDAGVTQEARAQRLGLAPPALPSSAPAPALWGRNLI